MKCYSEERLDNFLLNRTLMSRRKVVAYCRVSSHRQSRKLQKQIEEVSKYSNARGYEFEIVADVGIGINYNRKGLNQLLDMVINSEVERIIIHHKDILAVFGYELIENLCARYGVYIEVIDNTEKAKDTELIYDLVQIMKVFASKLQERNAKKINKMLKELSGTEADIYSEDKNTNCH